MAQNEFERLERLLRMQVEEAEKQRQFEREKAGWGASRRTDQKETPKRSTAQAKKDPYEVLGVGRNASLEEVRKAYAELSMKYHPDRVNHLGVEFQDMAHQKYLEIKDAWETIQRDRKAK